MGLVHVLPCSLFSKPNIGKNIVDGPNPSSRRLQKVKVPFRIKLSEGPLVTWKKMLQMHALIGRFNDVWPAKGDILEWVKKHWGFDYGNSMSLLLKGDILVIFSNTKLIWEALTGEPWFLKYVGFFLKSWFPGFSSERDHIHSYGVWFRLFGLPCKYWSDQTLKINRKCPKKTNCNRQ